ncbi:hypothetical protein HK405_012059, partial [Cladochytrium tenue]
ADGFRWLVRRTELLEECLRESPLSAAEPDRWREMLAVYGEKLRLAGKMDRCRKRLRALESVLQLGAAHEPAETVVASSRIPRSSG